eukprot:1195113-Prorocentrum_minimum.AAC.1
MCVKVLFKTLHYSWLPAYEAKRQLADASAVSRLSPYIHFGVLSTRHMHHRLVRLNCKTVSKTFNRRLVWRDLAYWQLHHWPHMAERPIRTHYNAQVGAIRARTQCYTNVTPPGKRRATVLHKCHTTWPEESGTKRSSIVCGAQEWTADPEALRRWQRGQTGFPLVDAAMRELWVTGARHVTSTNMPDSMLKWRIAAGVP